MAAFPARAGIVLPEELVAPEADQTQLPQAAGRVLRADLDAGRASAPAPDTIRRPIRSGRLATMRRQSGSGSVLPFGPLSL